MIRKLSNLPINSYRLWYNDWVKNNAKGKVLDVGKSTHWDYGFPTIDINPKLNPTFVDNIEKTNFKDEEFDTILCNGMYELVKRPQKMIYEVLRITKRNGWVIFGFVGRNYKPYCKDWKYYVGKEYFPFNFKIRKDFGKEYHYIICKKI